MFLQKSKILKQKVKYFLKHNIGQEDGETVT